MIRHLFIVAMGFRLGGVLLGFAYAADQHLALRALGADLALCLMPARPHRLTAS
jgi:hypothetical protein